MQILKDFPDNSIDLILTSPPYSNLRQYDGNSSFDFYGIAKQLYRVLKEGSVLVWIIGDKTEDGNESGESFRQVLYFKDMGFKLHDTMIYEKDGPSSPNPETNKRYSQIFEFMFILLKGDRLQKWHPLKKQNQPRTRTDDVTHTRGGKNDEVQYTTPYFQKPIGIRFNIWRYNVGYFKSSLDKIAFQHPAIMPEKLAEDHIRSWSDDNDLVLDPFMGSGTTAKMALLNNRKFIGIEINQKYIDIAMKRLEPYLKQEKLTQFTR